ncbi:terminase large subunit [Hansschlegelia plantiphila]|uniref:Terminase n=1 Tax=Hansschlegelia plantiphila TaxID=374655 RepID=A0A9W6MWE9_9HYPH|nr:terminase large subunit [Hansschlegelia plantiphila]GLK68968.1 terminase [Hansschlegelia plantiphila]
MPAPTWSTACPDWADRIVARRSLIPFAPLFPDEGEAALAVFKSLRMVDLPGQPTFGEACDEWVFDFVRAIFGAYDPELAERLISNFFLLISKKNGKSTIAAAIMVTALIRNWRHSAELLILAPTIEIAKNSFEPAAAMVRADPQLKDLLHVQDNFRHITHRITRAVLKVVAADTDTVGGKKAAFVLIDELWIFGKRVNASAMFQEATGGLATRPEGFVIYLSTQSDDPPAGVFKEKLDYFRDVRDGKVEDPKSLPVLYEFPKELIERKDYLDPAWWFVTNPNLGRSVRKAFIDEKLREAERGTGNALQTFLAKHLNVQIGSNLRANRWPGAEFWERRALPAGDLTFDSLLDRCEVMTIGLDGGGLDDLFGFNALGRERQQGENPDPLAQRWFAWSHAWCHKSVLTRRQSIASKLLDFQKAGELTIVDDELDDISEIVGLIRRVRDAGLLATVGVDPAGLGDMVAALATIGVTAENETLIGIPQGYGIRYDKAKTIKSVCVINYLGRLRAASLFVPRGGPGAAPKPLICNRP